MVSDPIRVGLRIDVDTYRGTTLGVPALCAALAEHKINATFFFSLGPDNMGRHLFRLLKPTFFWKMLRSKAASLYGWDILFKGTLWPGPLIGEGHRREIRRVADEGHEIGFHAWDHHRWQAKLESMSEDEIARDIERGVALITQITGKPPTCSAAPGWRCTKSALLAKERFGFVFNSDCRGDTAFIPLIDEREAAPQVPVNLPTYDEVIGQSGVTLENYNDFILSKVVPGKCNVLTIHAEAEGISCEPLFRDFLIKAKERDIHFVPLGSLVGERTFLPRGTIVPHEIPGREGWVACGEV